jgi:cell wall assembly regulator SMI1
MSDVTAIWQKLEQWMLANAPELHITFQAGASDREIAKLEQHLDVTLPEDYKAFLRLCDGQSEEIAVGFYDGELLSAKSVKFQWDTWKELLDGDAWMELLDDNVFVRSKSQPDQGVRDDWWNPRWIPFTHDGGGNHLCLDLEPAEGGTVGQIITMWHDSGERELKFPSFTAWLESVLNGIEAGAIVFDREVCNALVNAEDLA